MRTLSMVAAVLCLALAGCGRAVSVPPTGSAEEQADLKKMAGNWGIAKIEIISDRPPPDDIVRSIIIEVQGAFGSVMTSEDRPQFARIKLDPAKSPKEIDFQQSDKNGKIEEVPARPSTPGKPVYEKKPVETILGIYKFDGDKIILAVSAPGQPRPTDFKPVKIESKADTATGVIVLTFEKLTDEVAAKRIAAARKAATTSVPTRKR